MSNYKTIYVENGVFSNQYNGVVVPDASFTYLAAMDQDVASTANVTFNDLTVTGTFALTTLSVQELTTTGTLTLLDTVGTEIKAPMPGINYGEAGAGVTAGAAGWLVHRGTLPDQTVQWNETGALAGLWSVGQAAGTPGTNVFALARLQDLAPTAGAIPGFNASGRLEGAFGLSAAINAQLQNIGATTISPAQWGYVGGMNQSVSTAGAPTFTGLSVIGGDIVPQAGSFVREEYSTVAADAVADTAITNIVCDVGDVTITLPSAGVALGKTYTFYYMTDNVGGGVAHIAPDLGDTIEGSATPVDLNAVGLHVILKAVAATIWIIA